MATTPKFGVFAPQGWRMDLTGITDPVEKYETMTHVAQEAERLGFDSVWLFDHFHTVPKPEIETTFECWTSMAGLARDTKTIRLGQMVTCNGYRNPALMAKIASTVDVMSHGRLDFGIGAGWYEHEYRAYGYSYPEAPERLRMLADALEVIQAMWSQEQATYEGKYYQVRGAINEPKGVQKPHPPIWIGGSGEKVTLKLVAKYGDACNLGGINPDNYRHKLGILRQHCETLGRDFDHIIKSGIINVFLLEPGDVARAEDLTEPHRYGRTFAEYQKDTFVGTAAELVTLFHTLLETGVDYFVLYILEAKRLDPLRLFASEVMPAFRK